MASNVTFVHCMGNGSFISYDQLQQNVPKHSSTPTELEAAHIPKRNTAPGRIQELAHSTHLNVFATPSGSPSTSPVPQPSIRREPPSFNLAGSVPLSIALSPKTPEQLLQQAYCYLDANNFELSLTYVDKCLEISREHLLTARILKAELLIKTDQYRKALDFLNAVIDESPDPRFFFN